MSVVPEYLLQTTIVRGIKRMRSDTRLIDQLFKNLDQKALGQLRTFIKQQAFDLCINYPRTTLKVPAIVILLKNEKENQAFLGDSMGIDTPDEFSYDGGIEGEILGGTASVTSLSGNPKIIFGPYTAFTGTANTLRIGEREWRTDQFLYRQHNIRIVAGTGSGQIRRISGNGPSVIMVEPDWLTIPDATTIFEIVTPPDEVLGEPSSLYDRVNGTETLERLGGLYDLTYDLQVIGPNQELTIYLSIILKAIFTAFRIFLEGQGVINLAMSASDFTPRPEYQPDLTYLRAMRLNFIFPFDNFEPLDGIARSFRLVLEGEPPDGSITGVPILSDTSFEITRSPTIGAPVVVNDLSDVNRVYFGSATPPVSYDASFIQNVLGIDGTALASTYVRVINFVTNPGEYMYYALPQRFGAQASNFIDSQTNLPAGFSIVAQLSVTTNFGTEIYDLWRSDNAALGFVALSVQ